MASSHGSDSEDEILENRAALLNLIRKNGCDIDIENALNEKGVKINFQNEQGDTPLHISVRKRCIRVVNLIIGKGADVMIQNKKNKTALDLVSEQLEKSPNNADLIAIREMLGRVKPGTSDVKRKNIETNVNDGNTLKRPKLDEEKNDVAVRKRHNTLSIFQANRSKQSKVEDTYVASGLKHSLHGVLFQFKILLLFANRARINGFEFRLATEMDAAEKFDDIVLQYSTPAGWNWRFVQAKHKRNSKKVTINDLESSSDDNPFAISKYFVSLYKISTNEQFENANLKDFVILTNTEFDFDNQRNSDARSDKWKHFIQLENESDGEDILYFNDFRVKKHKLCDNEEAELSQMIQLNLLKNALATSEIDRFAAAKKYLELLVKSERLREDITNAKVMIERLKGKLKKGKGEVLEMTKKILNLKGDILEENEYENIEIFCKALAASRAKTTADKGKLDTLMTSVLTEAVCLFEKIECEFEKWKCHLDKYRNSSSKLISDSNLNQHFDSVSHLNLNTHLNPNSNPKSSCKSTDFESLEEIKSDLKTNVNGLKEKRRRISEAIDLKCITTEIHAEILSDRISKAAKDETQRKPDSELEAIKADLDRKLSKIISEIEIIEMALNGSTFDAHFNEFVSKFRFVTNFPNEEELSDLISRELGDEFHLLHVDLVSASFEKKMLDFLKSWNKGKAHFHTKQNADDFFREVQHQINAIITTGLSIVYPEELKSHQITFREDHEPFQLLSNKLDKFLHSDALSNRIPTKLFVYTKSTRLSAIKLLQILDKFENHKKLDSSIFMKFQSLSHKKISKYVLNAIERDDGKHNLLVVSFHDGDEQSSEMDQNKADLLEKLLKNHFSTKTRIILIASNLPIYPTDSNQCQKLNDHISFEDLDVRSQLEVLHKKVIFQGESMEFNELIDRNIGAKLLDEANLPRLLRDEQVVIGNLDAFSSISYAKDFYVNRTFHRQKINCEIFGDVSTFLKDSEVLFVTGAEKEDLIKLGAKSDEIFQWNDIECHIEAGNGIILAPSNQNDHIYYEMFRRCQKNAHWLEFKESNGFFWKDSTGNCSFIIKHIDKDYVPYQRECSSKRDCLNGLSILDEKYFCDCEKCQQKVLIIANDPGMGKSTLLTSLARKMKGLDGNGTIGANGKWIIRINLNDYANENEPQSLQKIAFDGNSVDEAINFITKMAIPDQDDFKLNADIQLQQKLFELSLKGSNQGGNVKKPKIILMFDGFDEISPDYTTNATNLIKALQKSAATQIWVTTRAHEKDHLQKELTSPAYILNPLTENDQKYFLNRYWKWNFKYKSSSTGGRVSQKTGGEISEYLKIVRLPNKDYAEQLKESIAKIWKVFDEERDEGVEEFQRLSEQVKCEKTENYEEVEKSEILEKAESLRKFERLQKSIDQLNFSKYIDGLLSQWNKTIFDKAANFTTVPLLLQMFSVIILGNHFQLPGNIRLTNLYEKFIDTKFKIYFQEKEKKVQGNIAAERARRREERVFYDVHIALAASIQFPKENFKFGCDELNRLDNDVLARIGLLTLKGDRLEFIHRSFAEYFCSRYLINNVNDEKMQILLTQTILLENRFELICQFFDDQIEKNLQNPERIDLKEGAIKLIPLDIGPKSRTFFSAIVEKGYHGICAFFLKGLRRYNELRTNILTQMDDFSSTFLDVAISRRHHKVCQALLDESCEIEPEILKTNVLKLGNKQGTPLIQAAHVNSRKIVEIILNFIRNHRIFSTDIFRQEFLRQTNIYDQNALCVAIMKFQNNDTSIIDAILETVREHPDIRKELMLQTDVNGETIFLKLIDESMSDEIARKILKNLMENVADLDGKYFEDLAILSAYGNGHVKENAGKLLEMIDFESKLRDKFIAIRDNYTNMVESRAHLVEMIFHGDDKFATFNLQLQRIFDRSPVCVKEIYLSTDNSGRTVLHTAVENNADEICSLLLRKFETFAKSEKCPRLFEEFILKKNNDEQTALHMAAKFNYHQIVLELLKCGRYNFLSSGSNSGVSLENPKKNRLLKKMLAKKDKNRKTAIEVAYEAKSSQTVQVIIDLMHEHVPEIAQELTMNINMLPSLKGSIFSAQQTRLNQLDSPEKKASLLFDAVKSNDPNLSRLMNEFHNIEIVRKILTVKDGNGQTLLDSSICTGNHAVLNWIGDFLKKNADFIDVFISSKFFDVETISELNFLDWISECVEKTYRGTLARILQKRFLYDKKTVLMVVIEKKPENVEQMLWWLKQNCDKKMLENLVLATSDAGKTALHTAAMSSSHEIMENLCGIFEENPQGLEELLLKSGKTRITALHTAAEFGHSHNVQKLLNCAFCFGSKNLLAKVLVQEDWRMNCPIELAWDEKHHKTVNVILDFVVDTAPEMIEDLMRKIGILIMLEWAEEKGYFDLQQRLLKWINSMDKQLLILFKLVKNKDTSALEVLNDISDVERIKSIFYVKNTSGKTLLNLSIDVGNESILNWIRNYFIGDSALFRDFLSRDFDKETICDTNFLMWIKGNLEDTYPGTLTKLLDKRLFNDHTVLSHALLKNQIATAEKLLNWIKKNCDANILKRFVLAIHENGTLVAHSVTSNWVLPGGEQAIELLINSLENHFDILSKLLLTPNQSDKTIYQDIVYKMNTLLPNSKCKRKLVVLNLLKSKYHEIVAIVLDSSGKRLNLNFQELEVLKEFVEDAFGEKNKDAVLKQLNAIMLTRQSI